MKTRKENSGRKSINNSPPKVALANSPEIRSGMVRLAHQLSSNTSNSQVVKIGQKYFRVKELG